MAGLYTLLVCFQILIFSFRSDEFGKMKEEIPMAVLEARVKKATEDMQTELKVEGKEPGWSTWLRNYFLKSITWILEINAQGKKPNISRSPTR